MGWLSSPQRNWASCRECYASSYPLPFQLKRYVGYHLLLVYFGDVVENSGETRVFVANTHLEYLQRLLQYAAGFFVLSLYGRAKIGVGSASFPYVLN